MTFDPRQAALLELLLQGRPERVATLFLRSEPSETREAAAKVTDALASVALALPPENPPAALKERFLRSLASRAKSRAALVVIDMLNDHLAPGGSVEVPRARDIVPALAWRLEAARQEGVPIVYVVDRHEPDDADFAEWTTHNVAGTKGAEVWPPLAPQPGDRVVPKSTYSAFVGSELDAVLGELEVDTLVLTGCLTEIGIMATASDALQRGYAVEVPPDSQAGLGPVGEGAALAALSLMAPYGPARRAKLASLTAKSGAPASR